MDGVGLVAHRLVFFCRATTTIAMPEYADRLYEAPSLQRYADRYVRFMGQGGRVERSG